MIPGFHPNVYFVKTIAIKNIFKIGEGGGQVGGKGTQNTIMKQ